jgi:ORF6N domain
MPRRPQQTASDSFALDAIQGRILVVRGVKVLLDSDLAALYGVETRRLNEQVRRNRERFPADFLIEPSVAELENLMSQFATSSWGGRRKRPLAFTEHGAIMAASVLNAPRAIEMSVHVVRAFVSLRETIAGNRVLQHQLDMLERQVERKFSAHDQAIVGILKAIRELMALPEVNKRPIGFVTR